MRAFAAIPPRAGTRNQRSTTHAPAAHTPGDTNVQVHARTRPRLDVRARSPFFLRDRTAMPRAQRLHAQPARLRDLGHGGLPRVAQHVTNSRRRVTPALDSLQLPVTASWCSAFEREVSMSESQGAEGLEGSTDLGGDAAPADEVSTRRTLVASLLGGLGAVTL